MPICQSIKILLPFIINEFLTFYPYTESITTCLQTLIYLDPDDSRTEYIGRVSRITKEYLMNSVVLWNKLLSKLEHRGRYFICKDHCHSSLMGSWVYHQKDDL